MEMLFKPLQLNKIKLKIFCHWFCSLYSIISVQIVPIFWSQKYTLFDNSILVATI